MTDRAARPRSIGATILAVIFAVLALSAGMEAVRGALQPHDEPPPLSIMQAIVATLAALAAIGSWRRARWSAWVALAYGLVAGGMILSLGSLLDLDVEARRGLWSGAAVVFVFGVWAWWYLRRVYRRSRSAS